MLSTLHPCPMSSKVKAALRKTLLKIRGYLQEVSSHSLIRSRKCCSHRLSAMPCTCLTSEKRTRGIWLRERLVIACCTLCFGNVKMQEFPQVRLTKRKQLSVISKIVMGCGVGREQAQDSLLHQEIGNRDSFTQDTDELPQAAVMLNQFPPVQLSCY